MILEYKKTIKDVMQALDLFECRNEYNKNISKPLMKKLLWLSLKFKKVGKGIIKTTVLEDSLEIETQGEKYILKFADINKIVKKEGFIALFSDEEFKFSIHEKHFRSIEEKNQFLKIIEEKINQNKKTVQSYKGILNEVNYEDLTDKELDDNFVKYEIGNKSYRILIRSVIIDKKKAEIFRGVWVIAVLVAIINLLVNQMGLIRDSLMAILTLGTLILAITVVIMKKNLYKEGNKTIKEVKENLNGKNAEIKILKIKDGLIYSLNGAEEFISMDRIEKIINHKTIVAIKVKERAVPILLTKFGSETKKTQRIVNEIKTSIKNSSY